MSVELKKIVDSIEYYHINKDETLIGEYSIYKDKVCIEFFSDTVDVDTLCYIVNHVKQVAPPAIQTKIICRKPRGVGKVGIRV
jgi:hypothetical protein